jgi:hemolysin D
VFPVRVRLAQSHVLVHRKPVNLVPGMTVTTEIKTGSKRLIEYFFDVFLRYKSESLRER